MEEYILEVYNLYKSFNISRRQQRANHVESRKLVAVDGISFNVRRGEVYCLLGNNGAGKTTTLRMLGTLIHPDAGEILYDSRKMDCEMFRSNMAFLTPELKLDDSFTPNELFICFSKLYHVPDDDILHNRDRIFARFGISAYADTKYRNLSTGMKQKVSIAISLVHDPRIIIYDEPTNGLDIITSRDVVDFIKEEHSRGKTIIISTHIFDIADKLADTIGIIINGSLVYNDSYVNAVDGMSLEERFFEKYSQFEK